MGTYNPPVAGLLTLGRPDNRKHPVDYVALGIGQEHIPDLLRVLRDKELLEFDEESEEEDPRCFAHIHAWRALGQLKAPEAVEPLLDIIDENEDAGDDWSDWVIEELPEVLGRFGPSILPQVLTRIERRKGQYAASAFANVLVQLAKQHPEARAEVVQQLCHILESAATNDPTLNGFIISDLVDLEAKEAWPAIGAAYTTNNVDRSITGGADDAQYYLGLGSRPAGQYIPPPQRSPWPASPHPTGQNAKQRFNERQRQKKLAKKKNKKKRK